MNRRYCYLLLPLLFLLHNPVTAQHSDGDTYSFEFRGETLIDALDEVAQTAKIDLVYDPGLVRGVEVYQRFNEETLENLLRKLLKNRKLDYITLSSGTIVIVRTTEGNPEYGNFSGRIVDSDTGEPLPGATVMLADASGGTSTNHSGTFSMNRLLSGSYHIIFSYIGYQPVYKTIDIIPGRQAHEKVSMNRKPVDVFPVVVESHHPVMPNQGQGSAVDTDRNWEPGGAMTGAIRNLSLSSGVQYGLPMSDLHLQGGQRSEHRILLDGVPVYNPYSFGQMFSSFSPFAIGRVHLHKAGYGVQQGSQIAGLIDLSHDVPASGENSGIIQADPLSLNLRADVNIPVGEDGSPLKIMSALRTNFWNMYKDPSMKHTLRDWNVVDPLLTSMLTEQENNIYEYSRVLHESDVQFYDFHVAAGYDPDEFSSLSASFYMAENSVGTELLSQTPTGLDVPPYLFTGDQHRWDNVMGQVSWNRMISPRFDFSAQASYSANRFRHNNSISTETTPYLFENTYASAGEVLDAYERSGRWLPTQINGNRIEHFILKTDGAYSFSRRFKVDAGLQTDMVTSGVDISDLIHQSTQTRQSSAFFSSFADGKYTFGSYWNIEGGSRFTAVSSSGRVYAEPRLSVQYDRTESVAGYWSARISGGIYRQFIHQYDITNTGPASLVPVFSVWSHSVDDIPKAYHLSSSFLIEPFENTSVKLESFYKWQPDTPITAYKSILTESEKAVYNIGAFTESTQMNTFGAGIRINQSLPQAKLKLVAGYDYSSSQLDLSTQFGRTLPAPWNEPHRAQLRALWRVLPDVLLASKWQGIWGRAWGFRQSYYNFLKFYGPVRAGDFYFDDPGNDKLSPFHQLDLSVIYQPSVGSADVEMRLELINLLNRKNTVDQTLYPTGDQDEPYEIRKRSLPGFYPSVSLQVKF